MKHKPKRLIHDKVGVGFYDLTSDCSHCTDNSRLDTSGVYNLVSHNLLYDVGISIVAAAVGGAVAHAVRLPLLIGYLAAGIALGPHLGFRLIEGAESIATLSEIGLILLMFILGLEIDIRKLLAAGKAVMVNGVVQFVGCALLAMGWFSAFGLAGGASGGSGSFELVYLAVACSISSTLVVVKLLSDRMELDTLTSRITLGILIIQDLWAILFLALQPNLADLQPVPVALSLLKALALVATAMALARFVLPPLFKRISKTSELMLVTAMAWCFGICSIAGALHLSKEMGALIAGVAIASFPYHVEIASRVSGLRDFFITLFFVAVGLQIPMPTASMSILAASIVGFVLLSRLITVFPVLYGLRYGTRASLVPALNLSQVSEFALVLVSLGVTYQHVRGEFLSAFVLALVATVLLSSAIIPNTQKFSRWLGSLVEKFGLKDELIPESENKNDTAHHPMVLLGFFREASSLVEELRQRHSESVLKELLVVDYNPEAHHKLKELGIACHYGDISNIETLKHLELEKASVIVCTIPDFILKGIKNLDLLRILRKLAPDAKIIMTAESAQSAKAMYDEGASYVLVPRIVTARYLADILGRIHAGDHATLSTQGHAFVRDWNEIL